MKSVSLWPGALVGLVLMFALHTLRDFPPERN